MGLHPDFPLFPLGTPVRPVGHRWAKKGARPSELLCDARRAIGRRIGLSGWSAQSKSTTGPPPSGPSAN
jgi:hypothetical protein